MMVVQDYNLHYNPLILLEWIVNPFDIIKIVLNLESRN